MISGDDGTPLHLGVAGDGPDVVVLSGELCRDSETFDGNDPAPQTI